MKTKANKIAMKELQQLCLEKISEQFERTCLCGNIFNSLVELKCDDCNKNHALNWLTQSGYIQFVKNYEQCCDIFNVKEGLLFIKSNKEMIKWIFDEQESFKYEDDVTIFDLLVSNSYCEPMNRISVFEYTKIKTFIGIRGKI